MILIVGHGPSAQVSSDWIDAQDFVVRLFTNPHHHPRGAYQPHIGTRVDAIVTTRPRNIFPGPEFWLEADYRDILPDTGRKLSTGTVGCLIAHHKYPDEEIGVIGFDATLRGLGLDNWPYHDAKAEAELLKDIVKDYGCDTGPEL